MYTAIHASCSSRSRTVQGESTNSRPGGACLMTSLTKKGGVPPCLLAFCLLPFTLCLLLGSSSCNTLRPVTLAKPCRKGACQHAMTRRLYQMLSRLLQDHRGVIP